MMTASVCSANTNQHRLHGRRNRPNAGARSHRIARVRTSVVTCTTNLRRAACCCCRHPSAHNAHALHNPPHSPSTTKRAPTMMRHGTNHLHVMFCTWGSFFCRSERGGTHSSAVRTRERGRGRSVLIRYVPCHCCDGHNVARTGRRHSGLLWMRIYIYGRPL